MDTNKTDAGINLAYAALDQIPTPNANAKSIIGLEEYKALPLRIAGIQNI